MFEYLYIYLILYVIEMSYTQNLPYFHTKTSFREQNRPILFMLDIRTILMAANHQSRGSIEPFVQY